jgi:hypothetical protein
MLLAKRIDSLVVEEKFRGPPMSGNGGYVGGLFSTVIDDAGTGNIEVTLRSPIPLDQTLQVIYQSDTHATIVQQETLIAEVRVDHFDLQVPSPPDWDVVEAAAADSFSFGENLNDLLIGRQGFHPICFCCGVEHEDGLGVYAAPVETSAVGVSLDDNMNAMVAAIWPTKQVWADENGCVPIEYLWTAMDCPSQFAYLAGGIRTGLLGRISARVHARPMAGETLMVVAWTIEVQGKKHFAGSAIFDHAGKCYSEAKTVWIGTQ